MRSSDSAVTTCVIYLRVSTEEQARSGYSLPEQRERCLARAAELAGSTELQTVLFEDAAGGDLLERPGLEQVRAFVRERHPRYFVCLDPDRFSRKLIQQLLVTEEIEAVGTELVFVQHDYQKTPEGIMFYQMRGAFAQYEKAKILQRTRAGARRKLREGQVANGTQPYGYRYARETDTLAVVPSEAEWVRQIFLWAAAGELPAQIALRLSELGVPTRRGGPWCPSTIRQMLRNSTYIGEMICLRWNTAGYKAQRHLPRERRTLTPRQRPATDWVTVPVAPILERSLYETVQARLSTHKRRAPSSAHLLSGLGRCGLCGGAIHYSGSRGADHLLRCQNRYPRKAAGSSVIRCALPPLPAKQVEAAVWQRLTDWLQTPEGLAARRERRTDTKVVGGAEAELARLRTQLAVKRREQVRTLSFAAREVVDSAVSQEVLCTLGEQIGRLRAAVAQIEERLANRSATRENGRHPVGSDAALKHDQAKVGYMMKQLDPVRRRVLLCRLVQEVRILGGGDCDLVVCAKRVPSGT